MSASCAGRDLCAPAGGRAPAGRSVRRGAPGGPRRVPRGSFPRRLACVLETSRLHVSRRMPLPMGRFGKKSRPVRLAGPHVAARLPLDNRKQCFR